MAKRERQSEINKEGKPPKRKDKIGHLSTRFLQVAVTAAVCGGLYYVCTTAPVPVAPVMEVSVETEVQTEAETETETETETEVIVESPTFANSLEPTLREMLASYEGEWSVYVKHLKSQETISINEEPMDSASLIKLYIMGAVMEQVHFGEMEMSDTIQDLLDEMITVSDNEASNELERRLVESGNHKEGMEKVNDFIRRYGFSHTIQNNGLEDTSLWYTEESNKTSAKDCGRLLELIYRGEFVSHLASRYMEDLLLHQTIQYKIVTAVSDDVTVANKTGEMDGVENDCSIIFSPGGDYIFCILSNNVSEDDAIDHIREMTKVIYDFINPTESDIVDVTEYGSETETEKIGVTEAETEAEKIGVTEAESETETVKVTEKETVKEKAE